MLDENQNTHPKDRIWNFWEQVSEKCDDYMKAKEVLNKDIVRIVTTHKLFKENLFKRYLDKLKLIIKKIFDVKKNDILTSNNSTKTETKVLKCNFNEHKKMLMILQIKF